MVIFWNATWAYHFHIMSTLQQAIAVSLPQKMQAGIQEKKDSLW